MFSLVFYFILSEWFIDFSDKSSFMLQVLINIVRTIKMKIKSFGTFYHNIFFHDYNDLIKLLRTFLVILLYSNKRCNICLISFFNLYDLFLAFIYPNNIQSLVNNLFGVNISNPFYYFTSFSSPSNSGIGGTSVDFSLSIYSSFSDYTL